MTKLQKLIGNYESEIAYAKDKKVIEIEKLNNCIEITRKYLNDLRQLVREEGFKNDQEEIYFFKHQKPSIHGNIKFFAMQRTYRISTKTNGNSQKKEYIQSILTKLGSKRNDYPEFYRYFQLKDTSLDNIYFRRGYTNLDAYINTAHFDKDPDFSTDYDFKVAEIKAFELISKFFQNELIEFKMQNIIPKYVEVKPKIMEDISWTGSKTDLIELVYSLHASDAIKNGNANLKKMMDVTSLVFNIDLGNYHNTYIQIKDRKNDQTKFLDNLKSDLLRRIDIEDKL